MLTFVIVPKCSRWSVTCRVPVIVCQLNELIDDVEQVVVMFLQQTLVEWSVPKSHLNKHGYHGLLCGLVYWRLHKNRSRSITAKCYSLEKEKEGNELCHGTESSPALKNKTCSNHLPPTYGPFIKTSQKNLLCLNILSCCNGQLEV